MPRGRGRGRGTRGRAQASKRKVPEEPKTSDEGASTSKLVKTTAPTRGRGGGRKRKNSPVAGPSRKVELRNVDDGEEPGTSKSTPAKKCGRPRRPRAEEIELEAELIPSTSTVDWNPFEVFPKEVWELIFEKLEDPKEMYNVMNSTPEWRSMYESRRTTLLFEQVVTVLAETEDPFPREGLYFREKFLERNEYLKCRHVNKAWDKSVQNYIQKHPIHFEFDVLNDENALGGYSSQDKYTHQSWQENEQFAWFLPDQIEEDLVEMSKTHPPEKNPFLTRQITLHDMDLACPCCQGGGRPLGDEYARRWWAAVVSLLERYGSHVWHSQINFHRNMTPLSWYIHIQHWIDLMQNLRVLDIVYGIDENPLRRREVFQLENQIAISPFPNLNHLTFLKISDAPFPVFNELIRRIPNLEKLQITMDGKNGVRLSQYDLSLVPTQKLKEAYLTVVSNEDFHHLRSSIRTWPLETLYLNVEYTNKEAGTFAKWPEWNSLFNTIGEKFGATLTELKLQLPRASKAADKKKILNQNLTYRLDLPHVKKVRLVMPNLTSLDFLLPMKNLKSLSLVVDHCESNSKDAVYLKRREVVKFNGNYSCLRTKSNIWTEFPKLEDVEIHVLKRVIPIKYRQSCSYSRYFHDKKKDVSVVPRPITKARRRFPTVGRRRMLMDDNFCSIM